MNRKANLSIFILFLAFSLNAQNFYVATTGNDRNDGTKGHPFASLERARDAVRNLHAKGYHKTITVFLREGTYSPGHTFVLTAHDSGYYNSPVVYTAYNNEQVSFNGGVSVPLTAITNVSDPHALQRFKPEARKHILQVDLKALGITDYGELHTVGFGRSMAPLWMEVFVNNQPFQMARWPNTGFVPLEKVIKKGATYSNSSKDTSFAQFTYTNSEPSIWHHSSSIWLEGYFNWGYADEMVKIDTIDALHHTITLAEPTNYGVSSGKPFERWYALNVPEELDTVGEYYIDRAHGILYFYPQQPVRSLELSMQTEPLVMLLGASNIQFRNITFECSRGIGIYMEHTSNNRIEGCQFRDLGLNAVCIGKGIGPFAKTYHYQPLIKTNNEYDNDGGNNNGLIDCSIYNTGAGGILLGGGNRFTLTRGNNFVENCTLHDVNRIYKTYHPAITFLGVGNRVSNCDIYNAPSQAILLGGNDQTIEYNNIHQVLLETDDGGAIYYGRDPTERGEVVRYNFFHDLGSAFTTTCVYVDDGSSGTTVFGNVFYKIGTYGVLIGGGSDCPIQNNLFVDCHTAIYVDNRLENWAAHLLSSNGQFDQKLKAINYNQPPYSIRYPMLTHYWQNNPQIPQGNTVSKNVFYNVVQVVKGNIDWLSFADDNWVTSQNPGFIDFDTNAPTIKDYIQILNHIKHFQRIPFDKIGVH